VLWSVVAFFSAKSRAAKNEMKKPDA